MNIEGIVGTESKAAWAVTPTKLSNLNSKIICTFCIIGRKSTKFQMNLIKDAKGVEETRFQTYKICQHGQ